MKRLVSGLVSTKGLKNIVPESKVRRAQRSWNSEVLRTLNRWANFPQGKDPGIQKSPELKPSEHKFLECNDP